MSEERFDWLGAYPSNPEDVPEIARSIMSLIELHMDDEKWSHNERFFGHNAMGDMAVMSAYKPKVWRANHAMPDLIVTVWVRSSRTTLFVEYSLPPVLPLHKSVVRAYHDIPRGLALDVADMVSAQFDVVLDEAQKGKWW